MYIVVVPAFEVDAQEGGTNRRSEGSPIVCSLVGVRKERGTKYLGVFGNRSGAVILLAHSIQLAIHYKACYWTILIYLCEFNKDL